MVSVIIPLYNGEKYIKRCIESVIAQTYKDIEVIVIDDGSTDNSYDIAKSYTHNDKRITVITKENEGVSKTRNKGISMASGEYIQFVDCDDYIDDHMTEKLVCEMEQSDGDIVICGCTELHEDHKRSIYPAVEGALKVKELSKYYPSIFNDFLLNGPVNKLYKKEFITKGFPEDMSLGEDLLFNLSYIKNIENISFIKDELYFYEIHSGSLNRKYRKDSIDIAEKLYINSMEFIKYTDLGEEAVKDVSRIFMQFLFYGLSDKYALTGDTNKEKKLFVKKWMNNKNAVMASSVAVMNRRSQKAALFMFKRKWIFLFHLMLLFKSSLSK